MPINLQHSITLQDSRVLLKPIQSSDLVHLLPFAVNEHELWNYSVIRPIGYAGMAKYVSSAVEAMISGREYPFIILDIPTQNYIGSTRFFDINTHSKCAQIGHTWYGKDYQGQAINKHCKYLMLEWAFEEMGFERIECRVDSENHRSIRSLTRMGYQQEGILRSNGLRGDGSRRDSIVYSILKSEWLREVKCKLQNLIGIPQLPQQAKKWEMQLESVSWLETNFSFPI